MTVKIAKERVTPTKARKWLDEYNVYNRPLRSTQVSYLVETLRAGEWEDTSDTIKFNGEGGLVDGQHRLAAIVESGRSLTLWVARGLSSDSFNAIDQNKPRSLSDMLARDGEAYYTQLAASLRWLWVFSSDEPGNVHRGRLRIPVAYRLLAKNGALREIVPEVMAAGHKTVGHTTMISGALQRCRKFGRGEADNFWMPVVTGEELAPGMPNTDLHKKLVADRISPEKMSPRTRLLLFVKCWNAYRDGVVLDNLRITKEDLVAAMR